MLSKPILGYLCLAVAQIALGIVVVISKVALDLMPIMFYLMARFFVTAFGLTVAIYGTQARWTLPQHPQGRLTVPDWSLMILGGLFAGFFFNYLLLWGLEYTTATSAGIIGSALPAITAISAYLLLKERLSFIQIFAIALAMLGIVIIGLNNPADPMSKGQYGSIFGDLLVFVSLLPEAWYSIINKYLTKRVTPIASAWVASIVTVLCFCPFGIYVAFDMAWSDFTGLSILLILGAGICSLLFYWLWPYGLRHASASYASLFGGLMPVTAVICAILFLGEDFHLFEGVGMLLIFISIALGSGQLGKKRLFRGTFGA